eukprot:GAFH01004725.1.p2 GENE.GAFH01004725.1~~GAFH01004725.1.p2  ORF type:complete len:108 (+),score=8.83 GAFH01004725.1:389-712(+)
MWAGSNSGRTLNKFSEVNPATGKPWFTAIPAVSSELALCPRIQECIGHLECIVDKEIEMESDGTSIFIARVVAGSANRDVFNDGYQGAQVPTLHHAGGSNFFTLTRC